MAAAEQITVLIKNKLRLLWNHAAEVLREDDKVHRPRVMKPRETMMDDIQEVLMAQAQAGVESWGEAETRLSNTTNRVRQQWVRTYREARAQNTSAKDAAAEAAKVFSAAGRAKLASRKSDMEESQSDSETSQGAQSDISVIPPYVYLSLIHI